MTGKELRQLRRAQGVTQWQLAQAAQIRPGVLLLVERESIDCPPELFHLLLDCLKELASNDENIH